MCPHILTRFLFLVAPFHHCLLASHRKGTLECDTHTEAGEYRMRTVLYAHLLTRVIVHYIDVVRVILVSINK